MTLLHGEAEVIVRVVVLVGIVITGLILATAKSNVREQEEPQNKDQHPRA